MAQSPRSCWFWWSAGAGLVAVAAALTFLSLRFHHGEGFTSRPIVLVTLLLMAWSALYIIASLRALKDPPPLRIVVAVALLARLILLPSTPIQEDDVYRYLWDGRVTASGIDPYRFSPAEVERFEAGAADFAPEDIEPLNRLVLLKRSTPELGVVFSRVNNRSYATIYPPLVQAVLWAHSRLVPARWPAHAQVASMKALLALFDLATLAALIYLLRLVAMPAGLCVLYAWCPLVLKELSNSGHMDSIPALFVVLALAALARRRGLFFGLSLGLAIAAKLYALILLPLGLRALGLKRGAPALVICAVLVAATLLAAPDGGGRRERTLLEFALTWENHDAAFLWLRELWTRAVGGGTLSFTAAGAPLSVPAGYLLALGTILLALSVLVAITAWRTTPASPAVDIVRRSFLLLAALFLLGPLGFPWYFLWCVPLLAFAELRSWLLLPGLLMLYYLRFWFEYHCPGGFAGFATGVAFFDSVVVTAEFGAFYALLLLEAGWGRRTKRLRPS